MSNFILFIKYILLQNLILQYILDFEITFKLLRIYFLKILTKKYFFYTILIQIFLI